MLPVDGPMTLALLLSLAGSIALLEYVRSGPSLRALATDRWVWGVPWGSLLVVAIVFGIYLFVQSGYTHFYNPVVFPFRGFSYFAPGGIIAASFTHNGSGHVLGNLFATLVLAPIAEFAWGHYSPDDPKVPNRSWYERPLVRALVIVPGAVAVVGLGLGIFTLGPVIGFSGVVYAFAGFALVRYPLATALGTAAGSSVLWTLYYAARWPITTFGLRSSGPSLPGWASTAFHIHLLGLLVGIAIAVAVFGRRGWRPDPRRLWLGIVLYAIVQDLWAVFWQEGATTVVLFRGPALVAIVLGAGVIAILAQADHRPVPPLRQWLQALQSGSTTKPSPGDAANLTRHQLALIVLVLAVTLVAIPAVPTNVFAIDDHDPPPANGVQVADYTVTYQENVPHGVYAVFNRSIDDFEVGINSSGVIVRSGARNLWIEAVSARELARQHRVEIPLGGVGWRETVVAERETWRLAGGNQTYQVWLSGPDVDRRLAYAAPQATANLTIDNRSVTIGTTRVGFNLRVGGETAPVPGPGASATVGGLTMHREGDRLVATSGGTRVPVATHAGG